MSNDNGNQFNYNVWKMLTWLESSNLYFSLLYTDDALRLLRADPGERSGGSSTNVWSENWRNFWHLFEETLLRITRHFAEGINAGWAYLQSYHPNDYGNRWYSRQGEQEMNSYCLDNWDSCWNDVVTFLIEQYGDSLSSDVLRIGGLRANPKWQYLFSEP